jgi:plastocyanin
MRFHALVTAVSLLMFASRAEAQDIHGQFLLDGPSPRADAPPRVKKGDMTVRDWEVCAKTDIPDETLLVDAKSKGIANIVVFLRKAPAGMPAALKEPKVKTLTFDQKACRFEPRILPVQIGQTINCTSQDSIPHNLRTSGFANPNENFVVNQGTPTPVKLLKPDHLPIAVHCDFHGWMDAYWIATDHPYVAVTDTEGKFSIKGLPAGDHEFTVWHGTGYVPVPSGKTFKVTVKAGAQTIPTIKVPASHFVKSLEKLKKSE